MEIAKKFLDEGQPELALERLKKILRENNFVEEWRVHELLGVCFQDLADAKNFVQASLNAALTDTILRNQRRHFSNYLFALHYLNTDEKIFSDAVKIYQSLYRDVEKFPAQKNFNKKIHVAFIATHFLDSSAARFFEILLTDYDREKFFVSAWSLSSREDNFTKKIRCNVDKFFDVSEVSFEEIAEKIFAENADVLFDLSGHTDGGETLQILAYNPARFQISGIGYFDTTGIADYFLTDKFLLGGENYFSEKILEIEQAFAFQPGEKMILAKKNLQKIQRENFVFGCMNNFMKITDEYLLSVKKIMERVGNCKIIFRDTTPLESRKKSLEEKIIRAGLKNFEVRVGADDFFSDYGEIDLILDTFPYNGGLMNALAIYFEIPVINLLGEKHFSRFGGDILKIVGGEKFIAENIFEYEELAVKFAKNPEKNFSLERLTDVETFSRNFYEKIFELTR